MRKINRLLLRLAVFALLGSATAIFATAQAQSFDCHQAETDTEWAVCSTPELARLDQQFAAAYRQHMGVDSTPSARKQAQALASAWSHGQRDLCGGDVACLIKAYQAGVDAMQAIAPQTSDADGGAAPRLAPDCAKATAAGRAADVAQAFAQAVCGQPALIEQLKRIDIQATQLRARLKPQWRTSLDAQQASFAQVAYNCPAEPAEAQLACITQAIGQRFRDLQTLADNLARAVPDCQPGDVAIKQGKEGDAGMTQVFSTYLVEYQGEASCRLRGYPAISVQDGTGTPQPGLAQYSGNTYFTTLRGVPLPVVLSRQNPTAWFGLHTAYACDAPAPGETVRIALPLSQTWLYTARFDNANCPVTVTPISMMSMLHADVQ